MPNLGAKESADWQKLRAERRAAREQILTDLRNSSSAEKKNIRQEVSKKRNEKPRFEGEIPKKQSRERRPFYEQPESHQMNPMRDMPNGPAPAPMYPMNPMYPMGPVKPMDHPHR
jgi:hypothetical protein